MKWIDLQNAIGISPSVMAKLQTNKPCNTNTIDKVCEYLKVQPGDIMEYVSDENEAEKKVIEAQIASLQAKLKTM